MTHALSALLGLLGREPDELISICSKEDPDGSPMHVDWVRADEAGEFVERYTGERHVWFNAQPMERPMTGRGKSRDVIHVRAIYADLDFKRPGKQTGMSPEVALDVISGLSEVVGARPTAVVASGHGLQPWWAFDQPVETVEGALLLLRWREMVIRVAADHGATVDTQVYDLPRILRAPGGINIKWGGAVPTAIIESLGSGRRVTLAQVEAGLSRELGTDRDGPEILKWHGAPGRREDSGTGDRVFSDAEAMEHLETYAFTPARDTPWGAGEDYWKVIWQCALVCSHFTDMFEEDDLREGLRQAIRDGHDGQDANANDETQIALGFAKGGEWQARRPDPQGNPFGPDAHYVRPGRVAGVGEGLRDKGHDLRTKAEKSVASNGPVDPGLFPDAIPDEFWDSRPILTHLRQSAISATASPEAVLALVLTNAIAHTMPNVGLPKIGDIPGRERPGVSSLNLLACIVAPPGVGKDEAMGVARDCVRFITPVAPLMDTVGSGEGIGGSYVGRHAPSELAPKVLELGQHAWMFTAEVSESDTLSALAGRAGNTLLPEIRKAAMGQRLGFKNADKARCYPVDAGTYRFTAVVLAQPSKLGWLFDDDEGGTPQRFLYAFAGNLNAPDLDSLPAWPGERAVNMPAELLPETWLQGYVKFPPGITRAHLKLPVCVEATGLVMANRIAGQRMQTLSDEAHTTFTRMKVAAALAFIDGRAEIASQDWDLSEFVMDHSKSVRVWVEGELSARAARKAAMAGVAMGHQSAEAKKTVAARSADESDAAAEKIVAHIAEQGEQGETWGRLLKRQRYVDKDIMNRAKAELVVEGRIRVEVSTGNQGRTFERLFAAGQ